MNTFQFSKATNKGLLYQTECTNNRHTILADELPASGGLDTGFTPTELLCSSLAACTTITLRMYINHKQWILDDIRTTVIYVPENEGNKAHFKRQISFTGNLDSEQQQRLLTVAEKCPLHKILSVGHEINTEIL